VQPDGKILAGGTYYGLVRLLANGTPDATFTAYANASYASAMALQADGKLLVGGFASGPGGSPFSDGIMRLTTTGALDLTFVRGTSSLGSGRDADAIVVQPDGKIVVASDFYPPGNLTAHGVVRYESTGAVDARFAPQLFTGATTTAHLYALALQPDGSVLVGGNFNQAGSLARTSIARLTATGQLDNTFGAAAPLPTGTVYRVAVQPNNRVLLAGQLNVVRPAGVVGGVTRLLADGQPDLSFPAATTVHETVYDLLVQPNGALVLGGDFEAISGETSRGVARLLVPNVLAVAAPSAVAARTQAWPVPAHGLLHVAPDVAAEPLAAVLLDALGRTVRQQALGNAPEFTLSVAGLPAGVYVLRVQYAAGAATRRVVVE
jgi:uncharacterized delta-60 repeat protein